MQQATPCPSVESAARLEMLAQCLAENREALDGFPVDALIADHLEALAYAPHRLPGTSRLVVLTLTFWIEAVAADIGHFPPASTPALARCRQRLEDARFALLALRDAISTAPTGDMQRLAGEASRAPMSVTPATPLAAA